MSETHRSDSEKTGDGKSPDLWGRSSRWIIRGPKYGSSEQIPSDAINVPYVYAPFKGGYYGYDIFKNTNPGVMYLIEEFLREYLAK